MLLLFTALAVAVVVGVGASQHGRHGVPSLMMRRHRCLLCNEESLRWVRLERSPGAGDDMHNSDFWVVYVCERCDAGFVYYDERWLTTDEFARLGPDPTTGRRNVPGGPGGRDVGGEARPPVGSTTGPVSE